MIAVPKFVTTSDHIVPVTPQRIVANMINGIPTTTVYAVTNMTSLGRPIARNTGPIFPDEI